MTAVPKDPAISELRELFRYLQEFRAVYETTGREEIRTPYGNQWSIWDLEYLYRASQEHLTLRQRQAISLCLVHNMREKDAAFAMGVSPTNPVMMYATLGIRRLLDMVESGELDRFSMQAPPTLSYQERRRLRSLRLLAQRIKSQVNIDQEECWNFGKYEPGAQPELKIRSVYSPEGFVVVHPRIVMYEAYIRPVPRNTRVAHQWGSIDSICVNPQHGLLALMHS